MHNTDRHQRYFLTLQDRTALGMKLEDEMELPRVKWENYKHSAKAGIGKATVKFGGRKEAAIGANAEYQLVAGEKENIQVLCSLNAAEVIELTY